LQVATIENQMYKALRAEGLTELEFLAVMEDVDIPWGSPVMASGFDEATYPVMLDQGGTFYMYSATTYDVFLIDKKGRLVTKVPFSDAVIFDLNKRLRKLHAE
jgi:hypothetical protein